MNIIVIGAGHGGLQAARVLAQNGFVVTVYEKNSYDELCYDWTDEVEMGVFDELSIPLPYGHYHTDDTSLIAPYSKKHIVLEVPYEQRDWTIERRVFAQSLADLAKNAGAEIKYSTSVDSLLIKGNKVCGVIVNGIEISAELVIDASGIDSPFRMSLPSCYKIDRAPTDDEVFSVWRAYMTKADGVEPPELTKKIHLMLNGEPGISWCFFQQGKVNILVGKTGGLNEATLYRQIRDLKSENPIIGEKITRGGVYGRIPIRYPLSRMVGDGYAAVGDSAFMTIPMIGSGIANSLRAGQFLADAIVHDKSVSINTLWKYQVTYYTKIGAEHMFVDMLKRTLLKSDPQNVKFIFESGIITQDDMKALTSGDSVSLSPSAIIKKVLILSKKFGFFVSLGKALINGVRAQKTALAIPRVFDETTVNAWQKKLDGYFQ